LARIQSSTWVYFVHSFQALPALPQDLLATVTYGEHRITAGIRSGNTTGFQFHPEKSGQAGLDMLATFISA